MHKYKCIDTLIPHSTSAKHNSCHLPFAYPSTITFWEPPHFSDSCIWKMESSLALVFYMHNNLEKREKVLKTSVFVTYFHFISHKYGGTCYRLGESLLKPISQWSVFLLVLWYNEKWWLNDGTCTTVLEEVSCCPKAAHRLKRSLKRTRSNSKQLENISISISNYYLYK